MVLLGLTDGSFRKRNKTGGVTEKKKEIIELHRYLLSPSGKQLELWLPEVLNKQKSTDYNAVIMENLYVPNDQLEVGGNVLNSCQS